MGEFASWREMFSPFGQFLHGFSAKDIDQSVRLENKLPTEGSITLEDLCAGSS
jgi:hypothetical protein